MLAHQSDVRTVRRLLHYLQPYKSRLMAACLCSAAVGGLTALYAWLVRPFLDGIFIEKSQVLLVLLPVALLGVAALKALLAYAQAYLMAYISNWLVADLREHLFLQLIHLPVRFHDSNASGRLISRVMSDVGVMGSALPSILKNLIQQLFTFLAMVGVLVYQDWKLSAVLLLISPVALYGTSRIGGRLRRLATRGQEVSGDMTAYLKEVFSSIRILKVYGREDFEQERFRKYNRSYARTTIKSGQLSALMSPMLELLGMAAVTAIIVFGAYQVVNGTMTPGAFSSFLVAMIMAYTPIRRLAGTDTRFQASLAAAQRVFDVLDLEHERVRDAGKAALSGFSSSVEFRHVSFRHDRSQAEALVDISLTIQVGEVLALVGKTGSGKTTLVSLLPRLYDCTAGQLLINGTDIRTYTLHSLRQQIAIVSQETVLFDDTVKHNIAYARPDASEQEILDAAAAAYALEFIERLPHELETRIGESGVMLSGGQRQRLAIARAILRNAPLLILDEATSALDSVSEQLVQQALANLMKGRTTLVIAHRLSTIQRADRIAVLDQGRLVGCGTHTELITTCGVYRQLCEAQFQYSPVTSG